MIAITPILSYNLRFGSGENTSLVYEAQLVTQLVARPRRYTLKGEIIAFELRF